jgi:hypothetical protein
MAQELYFSPVARNLKLKSKKTVITFPVARINNNNNNKKKKKKKKKKKTLII